MKTKSHKPAKLLLIATIMASIFVITFREAQIFGNPLITQKNVENRIQERIKGFDTFDVPKRREIAEWLEKVLNPPFGETLKIEKEEVIKEMGELTLTERNNEIKILLIRALEGVLRYGAEIYAIPYLTKILEDETIDPETRALAAHSLGWSRRKSTVPYLVKFTKDRNNSVRRSVAWSLFAQSRKDPELMLPFVIEAIRVEEEPHAIQYFAWALRDIGNKNAIPALKEALARGVQRKDKSISYVIQALIRLDNSVIREILTDGSDFERRLLGEEVSYIRAVDSSFKEILLDRKEAITLRRSVITLIRQEGEKWPYKIERLLKDKILFDSIRQMTIDEKEDTLIKIEAERIMAIFRKQQK